MIMAHLIQTPVSSQPKPGFKVNSPACFKGVNRLPEIY